jgi:uncharacterized membrane protein YphA (DoxX/SURF4 family)
MTPGGARLAALVRILTGAIFVAEGMGKILGPFVRGGFAKATTEMLPQAWPFWRALLRSFELPHASAVGWIVAIGELAVGIALLLGLLTPFAAAGVAALKRSIRHSQS